MSRDQLAHHNIEGVFERAPDGLITCHRDCCRLWSWSRQALGLPGVLRGWTPVLKRRVRTLAAADLQKFSAQPRSAP
jgi:hypothetical protein